MSHARPTALVFASLAIGQVFNLVSLSLISAHLGLTDFGRFGVCMLDFTIFANLANFALPAASITMAVKGRFRNRVFAVAMGARWWTSLAAAALYIAFEQIFREKEMARAALALTPAVLLNPAHLEWWFAARQSWRQLLVHRALGGAVTVGMVLLGLRLNLGLAYVAAAFSTGIAAAALYLLAGAAAGGQGLRLPWPKPGTLRMRYLWWKSLPIALTGVCDFLFVPLGYYAFKEFAGNGPLLGSYAAAYRIILAASMFASSLVMVLLPRFAGQAAQADLTRSLRRAFDGMALALAVPMLAVPFLARPLLTLFFPRAGWDQASLGYASWALSTMGLATYFHLLRMPPLTKALAEGKAWAYCRRFFIAGAANAVMVGAGAFYGHLRLLPLLALSADAIFTSWWLASLYPAPAGDRTARWIRLGALAAWAAFYLAWARYWA